MKDTTAVPVPVNGSTTGPDSKPDPRREVEPRPAIVDKVLDLFRRP